MKAQFLSADVENIKRAASIIRQGGLVVYPTETVYGLGCDPFNEYAVRKVSAVKGRGEKPFPLLVSGLKMAKELAWFSAIAEQLVSEYWPGPLTLILKNKEKAPSFLGGDPKLIGLRMPNYSATLSLVALCGGYLLGTSANITGEQPPETADQAALRLGDKVDVILNGGRVRLCKSSTILDLSNETPTILRKGPVEVSGFLKRIGFLTRIP